MDSTQIKCWLSGRLPMPLRHWLWERKIGFGNRRIQELGRHFSLRIHAAAARDRSLLQGIHSKAEWECFRNERIAALRHVMDEPGAHSPAPDFVVTGRLEQSLVTIENVVFQGHRGLPVTANIYRPIQSLQLTPVIIVCHSHHHSKTEEELQCMGMTLAQQGCTVLIQDLLGHGERRQHPFASSSDYQEEFRVDRQDYYFRSVLGMQLDLAGESLMGWMVQDVRRSIDLLCADPRIDQECIIVIGSVAGGGDISAVVGAVDERVSAVVAFNYGHVSMGDWDSTRNLPNTVRSGFWPWVILASLAPRRLIYAREFSWSLQKDDSWQALQKIYGLYEQREALQSVHGSGRVSREGPIDSHCTNIGPIHRAQMYSIFEKWFGLPIPTREVTVQIDVRQLECWTNDVPLVFDERRVSGILQAVCEQQLSTARALRALQVSGVRVTQLRQDFEAMLGPLQPFTDFRIRSTRKGIGRSEHVVLEIEDHVFVRILLLRPFELSCSTSPVVIGVSQEGILGVRTNRRSLIQHLLSQGKVVCLVELRGIGDGHHGDVYRGRISPSSSVSATCSMFGERLLCSRMRDLRTVIAYLKTRNDCDTSRIGLWGDSLANAHGSNRVVPLGAASCPIYGEPLGGVVALLTALFEPDVQVMYIRGALLSYAELLDEPIIYQPADAIIRDILKVADLPDIAAALAPLPIYFADVVDGRNRLVTKEQIEEVYHMARAEYAAANCTEHLTLGNIDVSIETVAKWFKSFL